MLDLCLINPPRPYLADPTAQAHLGLMYVAAAAEREGLSIEIVDLAGIAPAEISGGVLFHVLADARCFGITGTYLDVDWVNALAAFCKWFRNPCKVIVGGPVGLSADQLDFDVIDTIAIGEGEMDIGRLVREEAPKTFHGRATVLESGHWPARHLWPGPHGHGIFTYGDYFPGGSTMILSSRGCRWSCAFCASKGLHSGPIRFCDPRDVVAEMERVVVDFGVRQFRFNDEYLTANTRHVERLCRAIMGSRELGCGNKIAWRASAAVKPNDAGLFTMLRAAGCRELSFGVESADPHVLEVLHCGKGGHEDASAALRNADLAGIVTRALLMIGTPGETRETARRNIAFLKRGEFDRVALAIFHPVPGSAVAADPAAFGCRIRNNGRDTGLCLYGPNGRRNPIEPTIDVEGMGYDDLKARMAAVVCAAEATGRLGHG